MDSRDESDDLEDEFPLGDGTADSSSVVDCPYCGEPVELILDPGGGDHQEYVEDCEVCCRPWQVVVKYRGGTPTVFARTLEE